MRQNKVYNAKEVEKHNIKEDCFVIIHNKVYDVSEFLDEHPGGANLILKTGGQDVTQAFEATVHSQRARKLLRKYFVGELKTTSFLSPFSNMSLNSNIGYQNKSKSNLPTIYNYGTKIAVTTTEPQMNKNIVKEKFYKFKLQKIEFYNHNTNIFHFKIPLNYEFDILTCSHLIVRFFDNFEEIKRKYTPIFYQNGILKLLVKKYYDGEMSNHIHDLKIDEELEFSKPKRSYKYEPNKFKYVYLIAGGTGITPMIQIIEEITSNDKDETKINLIFANKTEDDVLLKDKLLTNDKLTSTFILSSPENKKYPHIGYIDEYLNIILPNKENNSNFIFICGRDNFCDLTEQLINKKGYTKENYFIF
eukprot:gene6396-10403_t